MCARVHHHHSPTTHTPSLPLQALALVFTFGSSHPGVQALILSVLCIGYGVLHGAVHPTRSATSHTLQTLLLLCLAIVALSCTPFSDALERGASTATAPSTALGADSSTQSDVLVRRLQTVFGVIVPAVALAWALVGRFVWGWVRTAAPVVGLACRVWVHQVRAGVGRRRCAWCGCAACGWRRRSGRGGLGSNRHGPGDGSDTGSCRAAAGSIGGPGAVGAGDVEVRANAEPTMEPAATLAVV